MKRPALTIALIFLFTSGVAWADEQKTKAVIGGGVGGALGAAIGDELGERQGAIVGSAVGAAIGTAVATSDNQKSAHRDEPSHTVYVETDVHPKHQPPGRHCPPGQAKKGRC